MIKLVLLRHGQSSWNLENRFTGWTDVDLTEQGVAEAKKAAALLRKAGFSFDVAYTSLLKRAIRTLWIVLDEMDLYQLGITFTAQVHESRRTVEPGPVGRRKLVPFAHKVDKAVRRFTAIEKAHGIENTIKTPDFSIAPAIDDWARGGSIEDLEHLARSDAGDVVRTLRMAIQMMRQLRSALGQGYDLAHRLEEAIVAINRDEVDAKRQFELG